MNLRFCSSTCCDPQKSHFCEMLEPAKLKAFGGDEGDQIVHATVGAAGLKLEKGK